jgi:hypothetical protein
LLVKPPEGWAPTEWTDRPPAPIGVRQEVERQQTRAEAEGYCFGFNTAAIDEGAELWAIAVMSAGGAA